MRILPLALLLAAAAPSPCGSFLSVPSAGRHFRPVQAGSQVCRAPTQKLEQSLLGYGAMAASPDTRCRMQEAPKEEAKQREFDLARGTAVDTLLSDYNNLFVTPADYTIFHDNIVLKDAQGFTLEGLKTYKLFFKTVQKLISALFSDIKVSVLLMDKYGSERSKIKLRWRIELGSRGPNISWRQIWGWLDRNGDGVISKAEVNNLDAKQKQQEQSNGQSQQIKGGATWTKAQTHNAPLVLEGISEYKLDVRGKIIEHAITISYPASPWSLAPLRELLPVRRAPGLAGVAGVVATTLPTVSIPEVFSDPATKQPVAAHSMMSAMPPSPLSPFLGGGGGGMRRVGWCCIDGGACDGAACGGEGGGFMAAMLPKEFRKKMPKQCKEDYDCNPGGYNFPLICADFVVARFCVDPDDWRGGGLGALAWDQETELAREPIPVRKEDGYTS